jgi:hypothetical protein
MKSGQSKKLTFLALLLVVMILPSVAAETDGLYYVSSGKKADIKVFQAHVYSQDNANTGFGVSLDTSSFETGQKNPEMTNPVKLRIGDQEYRCSGWGHSSWSGSPPGARYDLFFNVNDQSHAEAAAKLYSTTCHLRMPPGYKILAQFVPSKTIFSTNEPVTVRFQLKNLDERTIVFEREEPHQGCRDNAYGFVGKLFQHPVPDIGNPGNSIQVTDGLSVHVSIGPEEKFEDQVDLKKWFAFDKSGTYIIHGFYPLNFYPVKNDFSSPWDESWSDYASADFTIVVK